MYRDTRADVISTADNVENQCKKKPVACTTFNNNNNNLFQTIMYNVHFAIFTKYRDSYRIVTQVSRYVSYREGTVSLLP